MNLCSSALPIWLKVVGHILRWSQGLTFFSCLLHPECGWACKCVDISHLWYDLWRKIIQWADSLEKNLTLGKIEGRKRRGQQRMRWLDGIINSVDMNLSILLEIEDRKAWHATIHGFTKSWIQLSDWTTTIILLESESVGTHSCPSLWPYAL